MEIPPTGKPPTISPSTFPTKQPPTILLTSSFRVWIHPGPGIPCFRSISISITSSITIFSFFTVVHSMALFLHSIHWQLPTTGLAFEIGRGMIEGGLFSFTMPNIHSAHGPATPMIAPVPSGAEPRNNKKALRVQTRSIFTNISPIITNTNSALPMPSSGSFSTRDR